jgi:hypothetical protein
MATTTAPLLSFSAGGAIAKTQVYASWRGIPYVRKYVVPGNPNSTNQQMTRSIFSWSSNVWKNSGAILQAPWTLYCLGQPFYNRNAFIGQNTKALRPGDDLTSFIGSPGAKGGLGAVAVVATGSSGAISVAFTVPTPPTGWVLASSNVVALLQGDPHTSTDYIGIEGTEASTPWTVALADVPAGTYEVSGWLGWTKPDGTAAFGVSKNSTATVT